MPLFKCSRCGARENTALGWFWGEDNPLCSECAEGRWHDAFPKVDFDEYYSDKPEEFAQDTVGGRVYKGYFGGPLR